MNMLLVEDELRHQLDAITAINNAGHNAFKIAVTASDAKEILDKWKIDGVITDIYLPLGMWVGPKDDSIPAGLIVAAMCHKRNVSFAFCTSGYHHSEKLNWINVFQRQMGWPEIIDTRDPLSGDEPIKKNRTSAIEKNDNLFKNY
ncbi:MAG: hypothetical protein COY09_00750 [Candidatus Portnoybacteria bacterium CG_4_10_14_0_2_um_filter_39_11]|uniref:Response regulatory domain-containing protein n=1 Tax=Candidatus Portnoybacteria bacterium CG_4_10_14_0_2_um_filter_39_11 TaxID=1974797 RepID=A0A2M7UJT3_9BACT|nr:MAG: hypothetical protein AUJ33_02790 [Parcubacteria group bacterium CG1_02_40_25]PIZ71422.1 MAG: hypothetical protein COY09_00750 [Candidatus Portnoybacteria bacterium CG_4_10_14_0_2_um_filter_39_11]